MLFERINASGLGFTIGSISGTTVRDIIFRDSYLYRTFKGIYMKFRMPSTSLDSGPGLVENIIYENITMESPIQWPIWIGPAQQTGGSSSNLCHASPCSLCFPTLPFQTCGVVPNAHYRNITLKDVFIRNPAGSPGVIIGGSDEMASIMDVTFENVKVIPSANVHPIDLLNVFPSLRYPVHDPLAKRTVASFQIVAVLAVLSVGWAGARAWKRQSRRLMEESASTSRGDDETGHGEVADTASSFSRSQYHASSFFQCQFEMVILTLAMMLTTLQLTHTFFLTPKWSSPLQYFVCEGVTNGIAVGDTFPVPFCFEDKTDRSHSKYPHNPIVYVKETGIVVLLGLFWLAYYTRMRRLWDRAQIPCVECVRETTLYQDSFEENNDRSGDGDNIDEDHGDNIDEDQDAKSLMDHETAAQMEEEDEKQCFLHPEEQGRGTMP